MLEVVFTLQVLIEFLYDSWYWLLLLADNKSVLSKVDIGLTYAGAGGLLLSPTSKTCYYG